MSVKDSLGYYNSPLPVGTVTAFAGVRPPIKWLLCNGQSIPSSFSLNPQYELLFNTIGWTYSQTEQYTPATALQGTVTFAQNSVNFTAVITQGFLYAGKRIVVLVALPDTEVAALVETYDANTGIGTFAEGVLLVCV